MLWALAYARRGWPVFPCQPGAKEPATRHGFRDASTDRGQIIWWWQRQPRANLAIATGAPGPDVLDVDQRGPAGSGFRAYHRLAGAGLLEHVHALVATPSGGLHAYLAGTGQPSGRLARQHLDFKAAGGYVLAPPSVVNGTSYRLLVRWPYSGGPYSGGQESGGLDWMAAISLLDPGRRRPVRPDLAMLRDASRLVAWVGRLQPGNRNAGLYWAACRAVEAGQPAVLDSLAAAAARTGLPDYEITRTINSARQTARDHPPN